MTQTSARVVERFEGVDLPEILAKAHARAREHFGSDAYTLTEAYPHIYKSDTVQVRQTGKGTRLYAEIAMTGQVPHVQARLPEPQPGTVAAMPANGELRYTTPSTMAADQDGLLWLYQDAPVYEAWGWPGQAMKLWRDSSGRFHVEQPQGVVYSKTHLAAYPNKYTIEVYTLHEIRP